MKFYRPRMDRLEIRQLMASDLGMDLPSPTVNSNSAYFAATPDSAKGASAQSSAISDESSVGNPTLCFSSDSIIERSGSMVVIGSRQNSEVLVINDPASDTPKISFRLSLGGFGIQDIKVDGSRAIAVGQTNDNHTEVLAIDLTAGKIVNRVQFPPGSFSFAHLSGSDAWVVLSQSTKPIVSPSGVSTIPDDSKLIHLQWGESGLVEKSSLNVDNGQWSIGKNRLIMASYSAPGELVHDITLHLYDISPGQLTQSASLELKSSYTKSILISADGQRASLIRGIGNPSVEGKSSVDMLDLSNGSFRLIQSFAIDDFADVYLHESDTAMLFLQQKRQLVTYDLRSSSSSQNRTHAWDVPQGFNTTAGPIKLSNGSFGVSAYVLDPGPFFATTNDPTNSTTEKPKDGTYLLVLDPKSSQLQSVRVEGLSGRFLSLESGTNRIGIFGWSRMDRESPTFTFGTLNERLEFVEHGSVSRVDSYYDSPLVISNRLITAASDQVAVYDLEHSGKSMLVEYVTGKAPTLKAMDFEIRVPKYGTNLDPYSTYQDPSLNVNRLHLVALEGAPADVRISDGRSISFSAYEENDKPPVDFEYVISDGITEARGRVHVVYTGYVIADVPTDSTIDPALSRAYASVPPTNAASTPKHNTLAPLDVNEDGSVSVLDVLVVINAINEVNLTGADHAIDTSGNGVLEPMDVLLVINYLNRESESVKITAANASEETIQQIRITALKEHLARNFPKSDSPASQLLVGFEQLDASPSRPGWPQLTLGERVNRSIQELGPIDSNLLSQSGLKEYNLGSSKLGVWSNGSTVNRNTQQFVNLLKVGLPWDANDGTIGLSIVSDFGTSLGSSGFEYKLHMVDGKWQVKSGVMTWIS